MTVGTLGAQTLGTASFFALAVWLLPVDFGYWAGANSVLFVVFALANGGEINGYLSDENTSIRRLIKRSLVINVPLAMVSGLIALVMWALGTEREELVLVALLAADVPFMGLSLVLIAVGVKKRRPRRVVAAQLLGSVAKLVGGTAVASISASSLALWVALFAYHLTVIAVLSGLVPTAVEEVHNPPKNGDGRRRVAWALQSLSSSVPTQIDYLVIYLIAGPVFLGLYYAAYQASVGLSALVSGPLARVSVAEFTDDRQSSARASRLLCLLVSAGASVLVLLVATGAYLIGDAITARWQDVLVPLVLLTASLPARLQTPILEGYMLARGRWRVSIALNLLDGVGTAAAAGAALTGNLYLTALAVAVWKILVSIIREVANADRTAVWLSLAKYVLLGAVTGGAALSLLPSLAPLGLTLAAASTMAVVILTVVGRKVVG